MKPVGSIRTPNARPVGITVPSVFRITHRWSTASYRTAMGWFQEVGLSVPPGLRTCVMKTLVLVWPLR
jgi:hypothetical protein